MIVFLLFPIVAFAARLCPEGSTHVQTGLTEVKLKASLPLSVCVHSPFPEIWMHPQWSFGMAFLEIRAPEGSRFRVSTSGYTFPSFVWPLILSRFTSSDQSQTLWPIHPFSDTLLVVETDSDSVTVSFRIVYEVAPVWRMVALWLIGSILLLWGPSIGRNGYVHMITAGGAGLLITAIALAMMISRRGGISVSIGLAALSYSFFGNLVSPRTVMLSLLCVGFVVGILMVIFRPPTEQTQMYFGFFLRMIGVIMMVGSNHLWVSPLLVFLAMIPHPPPPPPPPPVLQWDPPISPTEIALIQSELRTLELQKTYKYWLEPQRARLSELTTRLELSRLREWMLCNKSWVDSLRNVRVFSRLEAFLITGVHIRKELDKK